MAVPGGSYESSRKGAQFIVTTEGEEHSIDSRPTYASCCYIFVLVVFAVQFD